MKISVLLVQAALFHAAFSAGAAVARAPHLQPDIASAMLEGKWEYVRESLLADDSDATGAVARLVAAHACLATNRNNEAFLLFLSLQETEDVKTCLNWATALVRQSQNNPVARYLLGDALSRDGQLDAGLAEFTQAIESDGTMALALSARGALRGAIGSSVKLDEALNDLNKATKINPKSADAYANMGVVYILLRAAPGALEAFDRALALSPEFALAYNGRGCAHYGQGEFDEAVRDFQTAERLMPVLIVAGSNQGTVLAVAEATVTDQTDRKPAGHIEARGGLSQTDFLTVTSAQFKNLVQTHGIARVQNAIGHQRASLLQQMRRDIDWQQGNTRAMVRWSRVGTGMEVIQQTFTFMGLGKTLKTAGLKPFLREGAVSLGKAGASAVLQQLPDNATTMWTRVGAASFPFDPVSAAGGVIEVGKIVADGAIDVRMTRAGARLNQTMFTGLKVRRLNALEHGLVQGTTQPSLVGNLTPSTLSRPTAIDAGRQFPRGYFTSTNRPLSEAAGLARMLDKKILYDGGPPRRALVVQGDLLRTNLLQGHLRNSGFETLLVPVTANVSELYHRWHPDVVTGVKPAPFQARLIDPGALPSTRRAPFNTMTKWNWGKLFVPTNPAGPGGIQTDMSQAFVDKHEWPVTTVFTLAYRPPKVATPRRDEAGP